LGKSEMFTYQSLTISEADIQTFLMFIDKA
jgi:hypothetical protein